jgi:hypothetical protein
MLLGRILNLAGKGSLLSLDWSRGEGDKVLTLQVKGAKPALAPLLPMNLAFREQMRQGGIHYCSDGSQGPWSFRFEGAA